MSINSSPQPVNVDNKNAIAFLSFLPFLSLSVAMFSSFLFEVCEANVHAYIEKRNTESVLQSGKFSSSSFSSLRWIVLKACWSLTSPKQKRLSTVYNPNLLEIIEMRFILRMIVMRSGMSMDRVVGFVRQIASRCFFDSACKVIICSNCKVVEFEAGK